MKRLTYLCLVGLIPAFTWLLLTSSPALADVLPIGLGVNLISNPGAELGSPLGDGYTQLADWTVVSGPLGSLRFNATDGGYPTGNSDGRPSAFNNLGQLAFAARFTDGSSGIFVSNAVAVPEPPSFSAILVGTPCLTFHRWRITP